MSGDGRPPLALPDGFRFGVSTAGYRVEGGFNGPGEPANNWLDWERSGRVDPSGSALAFFDRYDTHLDRAVAAGCDSFRLSVEWARCQPAEGRVDDAAFDRYGAILDACHDRGLQPVVTLHHFTHPHWLGTDLWLRPDAPQRFAAWVDLAVDRLAGRCRHWVTVDEPNALALGSYLLGTLPPGRRRDVAAVVRSLDHLLTGHVLAYETIKERQPQATVTIAPYALSVYEVDALLTDVLLARSAGVPRHDLRGWLSERRRIHRATWGDRPPVEERALRRLAATTVPLEQALPRAVAAVYDSACERTLDVVAVSHHAPSASSHLRPPGRRTAGGRRWAVTAAPWDDPVDPEHLLTTVRAASTSAPGLDVWVVADGMASRNRRGRPLPRVDGWTRVRYLTEHLTAIAAAHDEGLPVRSYSHWTLADDYSWGSYEPRFGLYAVDRSRAMRWSDLDGFGDDAAGTYRRLVTGLRAGDRSVLL